MEKKTEEYTSWEIVSEGTIPSRSLNEDDFSYVHSVEDHLINGLLFKFARQAKAFYYNQCKEEGKEYTRDGTFDLETLQSGFDYWFDCVLSNCHTLGDTWGATKLEDQAERLFDFLLRKVKGVTHPAGFDPVAFAFELAKIKPLPVDLESRLAFRGKVEPTKRILALACRELQMMRTDPRVISWYLSCRSAAEHLGISYVRVSELLQSLVSRDVIGVVKPSTFNIENPSQNKATYYSYLLSVDPRIEEDLDEDYDADEEVGENKLGEGENAESA